MSAPSPKLIKSVLTTLAYSDHFSFPLTLGEIHLRLTSSKPCSSERVLGTLELMLQKNLIQKTGKYYYLPRRDSLIRQRQKRQQLSKPQLKRAQSLATKFGNVPGVLAIYLTGSLAMENSDEHADIDLMIITRDNRLWTTRLCLTLFTELLGLRRRPHAKHSSGQVCLNLYLSPKSFALPLTKRSLYTAYELIQAVPLYDPHNTHSTLLAANSWIHDYLPNVPKRTLGSDLKGSAQPRQNNLRGRSDPEGLIGRPGQTLQDTFESLCYHLQLTYMRPKLTREYITRDSAFFHPNDPSPMIPPQEDCP